MEVVIGRTPLSQQADRRHLRSWRREVQNVVGKEWDAEPPFGGEVMVVITYFFKGEALDVDNMPKPILDALKGMVYADDDQITDLICRKRNRDRDLKFEDPSTLLLDSLGRSEQFLHITVANAPSLEVSSW
ncbi:MAG: RusA family crossover junction endodeoxyribonuclease [Chloroflexi bacterium]|nr:RusA family crossover junction endodeoxyribonuclease [Chloroflexota bacterium]